MSAASSGEVQPPPREAVKFLYYHVFLPPQLPQTDDHLPELDLACMQTVRESLATLKTCTPSECHGAINVAAEMLDTMRKIHPDGQVGSKELLSAFNNLVQHALNIRAQNAGVIISKSGNKIQFDVFELLPTNEAAMSTKGRLQLSFPGAAVSVDMNDFLQPKFQQSLTDTLTSLSSHAVKSMRRIGSQTERVHSAISQ